MSVPAPSSLYRGTVRHTRLTPFNHTFSYRVFYGLFDIDRLDELDRDLRWFSVNRFNLVSFDESVHGPVDGGPLRPWVESLLDEAGIDSGGPIYLLAFPRILGYVFNPISVWYCHDRSGRLAAVIHEVRNTFGDRHCYVVPVPEKDVLRHSFEKRLHVSPFNGMEQEYRFALSPPGSRISISIDQYDHEGRLFRAGMALSRLPFTDANLLRLFWGHPLLTVKVITAIHWQALKLKLKGATFHPRPSPAESGVTIVRPQEVSV